MINKSGISKPNKQLNKEPAKVACQKCGALLDYDLYENNTEIWVYPCSNCLSDERSKGYNDGCYEARRRYS